MHKIDINQYINKEINGVLVIKEVKSVGKGTRIRGKCLSCNKYKEFNFSQLLHRKGKNSCGCRKHALGNKSPRWKGYEEISAVIFNQLKRNAKLRKLEFKITIREIWNLFLRQKRKCALSGVDLKFGLNRFDLTTASLDRIDSSKGYLLNNVQWVHRDINYMKQEFNNKQFVCLCKKIYEYNK